MTKTADYFSNLFLDNLTVSTWTADYWQNADLGLLETAARKVFLCGANAWTFTQDENGFFAFAGKKEKAAFNMMTNQERFALLGWM